MDKDRINILLVDDVPEKLVALGAILSDLGHNIVAVGSGREALRQLLHQDFALILLDVNMPEMDGFETAAVIRQRSRSEHTPIIFVTGFSDETHVSRGYSLGAVDYILTPVVPEVLRAKVAVFADLYRKTELVKRQAEQQVAIAREQAARAAAEAAKRQSEFLADASTLLATSLDYDATINHAARLPVPTLADVCVLRTALTSRRGEPPTVACADGRLESALGQVAEPLGAVLQSIAGEVMQSGKSQCLTAVDLDHRETENAAPDAARGATANEAPSAGVPSAPLIAGPPPDYQLPAVYAAMVLPLVACGRVIGTLTLARLRDIRAYSAADVSLADDLAGRIAMAIDNANLVRKIQEGDRRKDEFLATLSHELRNPLAAISNALQCMEMAADSPKVVGEARTILRRQIQYVVRLVEDLLDVSRITRGKVRLRKEIVEVRPIVERAAMAVGPLVSDRGHRLSMSFPTEAVFVNADSTRLEQSVGNLLNNAAKYTAPGGQIDVAVEIEEQQVAIHVHDTGAGIPAEILPKIFDLFAQGDRTLDHSQGGLGIGLTLVRSLVSLHGGEVAAASPGPGRGSQFTIRLPLAQPQRQEAPAQMESKLAANGKAAAPVRRRVLLVDDNVDLAAMTGALLRSLGHEVHLAHDGPEALQLLETVGPEAMFVDIGLPGMSGHEVAQAVRRRRGPGDLFLVAMTGYGQAEDRRRSRDAGFDLHLVKPVGLQALENVLNSLRPRQPLTA